MTKHKKVEFTPWHILINGAGFILGFFFTDFLIPVFNAVIEFFSGGGSTPTQSIFGPVANMGGPMAIIIISILGIMIIALGKKLFGFISWLLFGLLFHGIFLAIGLPIPSILDFIRNVYPF